MSLARNRFQKGEQQIADACGGWRQLMSAMATAEVASHESLVARRERLEREVHRRRSALAGLERCQGGLDRLRDEIAAEMWELVACASNVVELEVGGQCFTASARVLRRSPWFARQLDALRHGTRGARDAPICVDRSGAIFRILLNLLRMGPSYLPVVELVVGPHRRALLEDAIFFELPAIAGVLAEPPVGAVVSVSLPSASLSKRCEDVILQHDLCGTWHAPGRCLQLRCRRRGVAVASGVVRLYKHDASKPTWEVECYGHSFSVHKEQLLPHPVPASAEDC